VDRSCRIIRTREFQFNRQSVSFTGCSGGKRPFTDLPSRYKFRAAGRSQR